MSDSRYQIDPDVRDRKVRKTLRRSFKKAHHFLGGDFDPAIAHTDVSREDGRLNVDAPYDEDIYRELYAKDAVIRQTDDRLDEELYGQEPLPEDAIEATIDEFEASYPEFDEVAQLFREEYRLKTDDLPQDERVEMMDSAASRSAADFMIVIDDIIDEYGTSLNDNDLHASHQYLQAFQAARDLMDDVLSVDEDRRNSEYNPMHNAREHDIGQATFEQLFEHRFDRMERVAEQVDDPDHRQHLQENTDYWHDEYQKAVKPIIDAYFSHNDSYKQKIFRIVQK